MYHLFFSINFQESGMVFRFQFFYLDPGSLVQACDIGSNYIYCFMMIQANSGYKHL